MAVPLQHVLGCKNPWLVAAGSLKIYFANAAGLMKRPTEVKVFQLTACGCDGSCRELITCSSRRGSMHALKQNSSVTGPTTISLHHCTQYFNLTPLPSDNQMPDVRQRFALVKGHYSFPLLLSSCFMNVYHHAMTQCQGKLHEKAPTWSGFLFTCSMDSLERHFRARRLRGPKKRVAVRRVGKRAAATVPSNLRPSNWSTSSLPSPLSDACEDTMMLPAKRAHVACEHAYFHRAVVLDT